MILDTEEINKLPFPKVGCDDFCTTINVIKFIELLEKKRNQKVTKTKAPYIFFPILGGYNQQIILLLVEGVQYNDLTYVYTAKWSS